MTRAVCAIIADMSVPQPPDFDAVELALARVDADADAADSHGFLCGLICAAGYAEPGQWTGELLGEQESGNALVAEATQVLQRLYEDAQARIHGEDMDFELLLPPDDSPLIDRAESLGQWCHGFLSGLGVGGLPAQDKLPEDAAELIGDLAEISKVDFDMSDAGEEDEEAFAEIVEFVRVGVLLLSEELQPGRHVAPSEKLH